MNNTLQQLQQLNPAAVQLAELVSLAVKIEPELLRRVRITLLPGADASAEADLWLSDLVETRNPTGIVLKQQAAELLRQRLAIDTQRLDAARNIVALSHKNIAPALQVEEKLLWLALTGQEQILKETLRSTITALVDPARNGVEYWAARALPHLPEVVRDTEEAQMLAVGTGLRVGEPALVNEILAQGQFQPWLKWLAPAQVSSLSFGVRLLEGAIEIGPPGKKHAHTIELPRTPPILLEIKSQKNQQTHIQHIQLQPGETQILEIEAGEVELQSVTGDRYRLVHSQEKPEGIVSNVHIYYEVEMYGEIKQVELPFVVGVLADLSGKGQEEQPQLIDRKFVEVDWHNFNDFMKALQPHLELTVADEDARMMMNLSFSCLDDFSPAALINQMTPIIGEIIAKRSRLKQFADKIQSNDKLYQQFHQSLMKLTNVVTPDELSLVPGKSRHIFSHNEKLRKYLPPVKIFQDKEETAEIILEMLKHSAFNLQQMLSTIEQSITAIDENISRKMDLILHHPQFQSLESAWRGLAYLVHHTDSGAMLKIRVLNCSKHELTDIFQAYQGDEWDQGPLFRKLYEEEYGVFGGEPYGCLIGDYYFDHSEADVAILQGIARIASTAHAPFISAASPSLMQLDNWQQMGTLAKDLDKLFQNPDYTAWHTLRESEDANYIAMTLPRILARLPYGPDTNPIEIFDYRENSESHEDYTWINAAYAMGANITKAFSRYGWCARIRGVENGGLVEGLPLHTISTSDGITTKSATEIHNDDILDLDLEKFGCIPLIQKAGTDYAVFFNSNTLKKPPVFDDPDATGNAKLASQLPYLFAICRFTHYLKCIVRDKIGSFMTLEELESYLNKWIDAYVERASQNPSEADKAKKPLGEAFVSTEEAEESPSYRHGNFYLRPHYQLEGLTTSLRITTRLPAPFNK